MNDSREDKDFSQIADAIRMEMIAGGISREYLAQITGLKPNTISNLICGNNQSQRGRRAIEAAMSQPFWHSLEEFEEMQKSIREHGWEHVFRRWSNYRKSHGKGNGSRRSELAKAHR